jgi:hypothetical protein
VNTTARVARQGRPPAPTATHVVKFEQGPKGAPQTEESTPVGRVPRVARLLALAHRIDGLTRSGELQDWAQAARLVGITRARMTQIANLLLLAPKIQERILHLSHVTRGENPVTERSLREVAAQVDWQNQEVLCLTPHH